MKYISLLNEVQHLFKPWVVTILGSGIQPARIPLKITLLYRGINIYAILFLE